MKQIGFIGLGNMGLGMASSLIANGHQVLGFDVDSVKVKEAEASGITAATSIREIANQVDTAILVLPHPDISKEVIFENLSFLGSTIRTIIDSSTLTPNDSVTFFNELKSKGIDFLCSPMLGGKRSAATKSIHFIVEGEREIFEANKSLFMAMGNRFDYLGLPPQATLAKLAYNICRYSNLAVATKVIELVKQFTSDTEGIYNLLEEGSQDNFGRVWGEDMKEMMINNKPYRPSNIPEKDLTLIIEIAKEKGISESVLEEVRGIYRSMGKAE